MPQASRYLLALLLVLPMASFAQTQSSDEESWDRPEPRNYDSLMADLNSAARFLNEGDRSIQRAQDSVPQFLDLAEVYVLRSVGRLSRSEQLTDSMPYLIEHITDLFRVATKRAILSERLEEIRDSEEFLRQQIFAIRRDLEGLGAGGTVAGVEQALSLLQAQIEAARRAGDTARVRELEALREKLMALIEGNSPNKTAIEGALRDISNATGTQINTQNSQSQNNSNARRGQGDMSQREQTQTPSSGPLSPEDEQKFKVALVGQGMPEEVQEAALSVVRNSSNPAKTRDDIIEMLRVPGLATFFSRLPSAGISKEDIAALMKVFAESDDPAGLFNELQRLVEEEGLTLQAAIDRIISENGGGTSQRNGGGIPSDAIEIPLPDNLRDAIFVDPGFDFDDIQQGLRRVYADRENGYLTAEVELRARAYRSPNNAEQLYIDIEEGNERRYSFIIREVSSNRQRLEGQLHTTWELTNRAAPDDQSYTVSRWEIVDGNGSPVSSVEANGNRAKVVFTRPGTYSFAVSGKTDRGSPFTIQLGAGNVAPVNIQF